MKLLASSLCDRRILTMATLSLAGWLVAQPFSSDTLLHDFDGDGVKERLG